ncbi:MAG: carbohydrate-binding domain-containing protein [Muribaculaceae bacterium]|nr:carbohydrate-binding domain-containing protein [Muribaculaceae bacterium]
MKKYFFIAALTLTAIMAQAQSINFIKDGVTYNFPAATAGEMTFDGAAVNVAGRTFDLSQWSLIKVTDSEVASKTVEITYSGNSGAVMVAGDIAPYIEVSTDGAHVTVTQSDLVSESTCGEITYVLKGEAADGSFNLTGSYKATIELQGVTLTNPSGAALNITNGKRIAVSAKNGTVNSFTDGAGSQKGAIACTGHLEFKGKGELNVKGNKSHAIYAKEYVEIKNLTLNITGSKKDGINCAQYFLMESGNVTIASPGDDGIQTSFKDDADREAEDTGTITIKGGTLTVTISADAAKCIKADADVIIAGGTLHLTTNANGIWDSTKLKTKASACIGADGNVEINGGTLNLKATGSGGKGISCDGVFTSNGGNTTIATTGGMLVYSNGTLNHNYTSSADRINSDYKSSAKGIKADEGVVINDGEFYITTASNNAEGIESKKTLDIKGGKIFVKAYDDGINSSNDFSVSGGDLTVISVVGDGLDSNGNLYISGGYIRTMGSGGMEMGLDAATEDGCAVYITGGTFLAFGGSNTYPTKSGSTQAFVKATGSITANTEVSVSAGSTVLATFTVPSEYTQSTGSGPRSEDPSEPITRGPGNGPGGGGWGPGGSSGSGSLMISCPELKSGTSYTITNNGTTTTATAALTSSGR